MRTSVRMWRRPGVAAPILALLCACGTVGCEQRGATPTPGASAPGPPSDAGSSDSEGRLATSPTPLGAGAPARPGGEEGRATTGTGPTSLGDSGAVGAGQDMSLGNSLPHAWRTDLPSKASVLCMDLLVDARPRVFCAYGTYNDRQWGYTGQVSDLEPDGRPGSPVATADGVLEIVYAYGATVAVLERGDEMLAIQQRPGDSHSWLRAAHTRGQTLLQSVRLGPPSYERPDLQPSWPGDSVAEFAREPSAALVGSEVWLASSQFGSVKVSHCPWGHWKSHDWARTKQLGPGIRPGIAWSQTDGLFVTSTGLNTGAGKAVEACRGPVYLCWSKDGEEWTSLGEILDEPQARYAVPAVDPKAGLVVVYAADRGDSCPLFAARSPDFGETWGDPRLLTEETARCAQPRAVMFAGRLYVGCLTIPTGLAELRGAGIATHTPDPPVELYTMAFDSMDLPAP